MSRLEKLSDNKQNLFFYQQLFRQVKKEVEIQAPLQTLKRKIEELAIQKCHNTLLNEKNELVDKVLEVINNSSVHKTELHHFSEQIKKFINSNKLAIKIDRVRRKEREYIKKQLIISLKAKNYEVVESEIVDFEKQSNLDTFMLRVPGKQNYINIEFNDNNTVSYKHYLSETEEEIKELSTEVKNKKIRELNDTCDFFHRTMEELKILGVSNKLRKRRPGTIKHLKSLPIIYKKEKDRINKKKKRTNIPQQKKRYLDNDR